MYIVDSCLSSSECVALAARNTKRLNLACMGQTQFYPVPLLGLATIVAEQYISKGCRDSVT